MKNVTSHEWVAIQQWANKRAERFYSASGASLSGTWHKMGISPSGIAWAESTCGVRVIATPEESLEIRAQIDNAQAETSSYVGDGQSWLHAE